MLLSDDAVAHVPSQVSRSEHLLIILLRSCLKAIMAFDMKKVTAPFHDGWNHMTKHFKKEKTPADEIRHEVEEVKKGCLSCCKCKK